jgi:oligopeptide transport system permease protein
MIAFLARRLAAGLLTLLAVATLTFFISRFAPGSPFSSERGLSAEARRNLERKYGYDKPLALQYLMNLKNYLRGELGESTTYRGRDVREFVWPGFAVSVRLGLIAFLIALIAGTALGILASARQNRWPDHAASSAATFGICVPNFLLGPLLVITFALGLGWFEPTGWPQDWTSASELKKLALPALTLAFVHVAYLSRLTRAGMLDVIHKDYIRTARAKGLPEEAVFLKHALKNGITPALTYAGPMAAYLVTGSIVVEKVFAIPGLGTHFINAATNRDTTLLMGAVLVYSTLSILFTIAVDVLYGVLDPRVRVS